MDDFFFADFDDIAVPPEPIDDPDRRKDAEQPQVSTKCPSVK